MTNELTTSQQSRRDDLERTIKNTKGGFVACGRALAEMRDSKLYRNTHGTFEAYCEDVWLWKKSRVYQLIEDAQPSGISTKSDIPRKAGRPKKATKPKIVKDVTLPSSTPKETPSEKVVEIEELCDEIGRVIPIELRKEWLDALHVGKTIRNEGLAWKRVVDGYLKEGDKFAQRHNLSQKMSEDIASLVYDLSCAIPYALCPFCDGEGKRCEKCHSRGWVSKSYWTSFVPQKFKEKAKSR